MISPELQKKMDGGVLYDPSDPSLMDLQRERLRMVQEYNSIDPRDQKEREQMVRRMFASVGENVYIEAPFYANWAGLKVSLGRNVYINFNCTLVDDAPIEIGDYVMIGPNVTICTAEHPLDYEERQKGLQMNRGVIIGNNAWLGAGVIINPGVTIGEGAVIGSGSVVMKDIPPYALAYGVPAVVRKYLK